ncbi:hypothetical protein RD792_013227 [Penstemon davidsonii]|uniref:Plant heme peroxidase family profile domain-containing protein n=1 Tax=Penstemon davidsonii TaxID=160366 RepID=A0ABR0CSV2_9LAMI|nr:hypothetical protein RD792_013227 [Penstemon davidsonii]
MRSAAADLSLLSSTTYFSAGVSLRFLVKNSNAVEFRGKRHTVACAAPPPLPIGRRALMYMATTSFLLPSSNYAVAADENSIIHEEIGKVLSKGKAAGLLRLVFHDAGTFEQSDNTGIVLMFFVFCLKIIRNEERGMNGSIVYELDRPENTGLKKSLKASFSISFSAFSREFSAHTRDSYTLL